MGDSPQHEEDTVLTRLDLQRWYERFISLENQCRPFRDAYERFVKLETELREFRVANDREMGKLNELRSDVITDRGLFLRRDVYDSLHGLLVNRVTVIENWQSKIIGVGIVIMLLAGLAGAFIERAMWR